MRAVQSSPLAQSLPSRSVEKPAGPSRSRTGELPLSNSREVDQLSEAPPGLAERGWAPRPKDSGVLLMSKATTPTRSRLLSIARRARQEPRWQTGQIGRRPHLGRWGGGD